MTQPMPKTWLVQVTAEDIAAATPGGGNTACPVARAMLRATGFTWVVQRALHNGRWVGTARIAVLPIANIRLSEAVGRFTAAFDAGEPVQPFAFRVWR